MGGRAGARKVLEVLGGRSSLEGRAVYVTSHSGVCHTGVVLWSNQAQHFGHGPGSPSLGKTQGPGRQGRCLGLECLSLLPVLMEGGQLSSDPRGASEGAGSAISLSF